ncbi:MAG: SMI1/KNR4 family protein [Holosporaceae bacterium]|nr:SMI1/KNR4 family protein [Holosporaceae bacterium]
MQFFDFYADDLDNINGIIKNNLELRKEFAYYSNSKSDMSHILVLSDDDGGSVFMITQDSPEKPTPIIWCDAGDMYHYSINGVFPHSHDEWPSFTDFFEYLVQKEEEELLEKQ